MSNNSPPVSPPGSPGGNNSQNNNSPVTPIVPVVPVPPVTPVVPVSHHNTDISWNFVDASGNFDLSYNFTVSIDTSYNIYYMDASNNDCSGNNFTIPLLNIVTDLSSIIVNGDGYDITTKTGTDASGSQITNIVFESSDPDIYENLTGSVSTYNNISDPNSETVVLLNQIRSYAAEIECTDFQGKGSIDDYTQLFQAAARIANETKQMELNVNIEGFNEFAQAADDLSKLFNGFIIKLQNVNIINDISFLRSIASSLAKIVNLSNVFGEFKEIVLATSTIQIPKSSHEASLIINDVMDEVNCAMQYIGYFVSPESNPQLSNAALSVQEQNIISKSVETINSWNILCEQGVSIAMSNDVDIQNIQSASRELKTTASTLKGFTSSLKTKLASFNIQC